MAVAAMARRKSFLERMLGGESQQARDLREQEFRNVQAHAARQAERKAMLGRAQAAPEPAPADPEPVHEPIDPRLAADLRDQNESLQFHLRRLSDVLRDREHGSAATTHALGTAFRSGGAEQFAYAVGEQLSASPGPPSLPARTTVRAYRSGARQLIIERELPRTSVIPPEQEYLVVADKIIPVPRRSEEVRRLYRQLLARIALRTVSETFALTPPALVDTVVLNGRVNTVDRATGRMVNPPLLSVQFGREAFEKLPLDAPKLDPEACLHTHGARMSPSPYDLVPVQPLSDDLPHYRTIA
jgi:restriction system protein